MEQLSKTGQLRQKLEARYAAVLPLFQYVNDHPDSIYRNGYFWNSYQAWCDKVASPIDPAQHREFLRVRRHYFARDVVQKVYEADPRVWSRIFRLITPIDERLNRMKKRDLGNPESPTNKKQTLRALRGVEEDIEGCALDVLYDLQEDTYEGDPDSNSVSGPNAPIRSQEYQRLISRRNRLIRLLPLHNFPQPE